MSRHQYNYFIQNRLVAGRFFIMQQAEWYPKIFKARDRQRNDKEVVVKAEVLNTDRSDLMMEKRFYDKIQARMPNSVATGHFIQFFGLFTAPQHRLLVFEPTGPNLHQLHWFMSGGRTKIGAFSLKTVLMLAKQMMSALEALHSIGVVHRDIKPENFVIGTGSRSSTVYLIDFNHGAVFRNKRGEHLPDVVILPVGNYNFLSLAALEQHRQSRRDDLEAMAYSLILLYLGSLPWSGFKWKGRSRKENVDRMRRKRLREGVFQTICQLMDEIDVFGDLVYYCRQLDYDAEPEYDSWRRCFNYELRQNDFTDDGVFEWTGMDTLELKTIDVDSLAQREEPVSWGMAVDWDDVEEPKSSIVGMKDDFVPVFKPIQKEEEERDLILFSTSDSFDYSKPANLADELKSLDSWGLTR